MLFRIRPPRSSLICSADNDADGGGGGGGGGNAPAGSANAGHTNNAPAPSSFDDTQREAIGRMVNAAVTSQLSRKMQTAVQSAVEGAIAPILERLGGNGQAQPSNQPSGQQQPANNGQAPESGRQIKELQNQIKTLQQQAADRDNQATQQQLNSSLKDALSGVGVEPLRMRGALAEVRESIHRTEDGQVFMKVQRQGYVEDMPLEDGLKEWAKSDVGKSYLAPKPANGSGQPRPGATAAGTRPGVARDPATTKQQKRAEAKQVLRDQVRSMVAGGVITIAGKD